MDQSYALAALYARQLFNELPVKSTMRSPGDEGKLAAHRVHQIRDLFFRLVNDATDFIEIGAHHAEASARFVQEGSGRRAFAFEANEVVCMEARRLNEGRAIDFHNIAIGATNGTATFYIPRDPSLHVWGSTKERTHASVDLDETIVPIMTLDHVAGTLGAHKSAIWMDVEGAQLDVLDGGAEFFSNSVSAVYMELYDNKAFSESASSVVTLKKLLEYGFIPVARDNQFDVGYNLVAVHARDYDAQFSAIMEFFMQTERFFKP